MKSTRLYENGKYKGCVHEYDNGDTYVTDRRGILDWKYLKSTDTTIDRNGSRTRGRREY